MFRLSALALTLPGLALATPLAHQGRLVDPVGAPIQGERTALFQVFDAATDGTELWSESHGVTLQDGYYSVWLDDSVSATMTGASWLQVSVDGVALLPRQPSEACRWQNGQRT